MVSKKRVFNIICTLCCIILIEFIMLICLVKQEPEVVVEEVEVVKEVEIIKEIPIEIEVEPTYTYNITSEEREMLARLVYHEANAESLDCQKAVVSVVINRWQNGQWGDAIEDVIYANGQFDPAPILYRTTPNNTNYEAVDYVLKNGSTLPSYVMFFRADYGFSETWEEYSEHRQIDQTYFGYLLKDFNN